MGFDIIMSALIVVRSWCLVHKVIQLLDGLSVTVSAAFFLQTFWVILISVPSARTTALLYLTKRLPKLQEDSGWSRR